MDPSSRVWIYQSSRPFTAEESAFVKSKLSNFIDGWKAHGTPLLGRYQLLEGLFIILMVDESQHGASGCSIDSSVAVIKVIEKELGVNLTDKSNVAYEIGSGIEMVNFKEIKNLVAQGVLSPETIVYDNSVSNYATFASSWRTQAKDTWLKRYFKS
jgi:hypothetical protein